MTAYYLHRHSAMDGGIQSQGCEALISLGLPSLALDTRIHAGMTA